MTDEQKTDGEAEDLRSIPADQRTAGPNATMIIDPGKLQSGVSAAKAKADAPVIEGIPRLVGRSPQVQGQVFKLTESKVTVGRSDKNHIIVDDGTISSRHAQFVQDAGTWRVINLISTNGTAVNGTVNIVSYLAPGDTVTFGQVEFTFEADSGDTTRAVDNRGQISGTGGQSGGGKSSALLWAGVGVVAALALAAAVYFLR